jgi:cyclohexanecarboxyl-CoA dehydrogenase
VEFDLSPEQQQIVEVARSVAASLAPGYVDRDVSGQFSWDVPRMLGKAGLLGLNVAVEAGGEGAGELMAGLVTEVIAGGDRVAGNMPVQAGTACKLLHSYGDPGLASEWLPRILAGEVTVALGLTESESGSDLASVMMTATRSGADWILNGEKTSVSLSHSQSVIVLANTPDGHALYFVPTDAAGVDKSPIRDMGVRSAGRAIMSFTDVRIPASYQIGEPGNGFRSILRSLSASRVLVCLITVGVAAKGIEDAIDWAKSRESFGKPLAARQGVTFPLMDALTEIQMSRLLCYQALWLADQGKDFRREAAMAKSWVPRAMAMACHEALLTIGHVGYSIDHPAQLRLRDVIGAELGEGTENIQKIILSRLVFGQSPS